MYVSRWYCPGVLRLGRRLRLALLVAAACAAPARAAHAAEPEDADAGGLPAPPRATIKPRTYSLTEILALVDRNHPNLWAARARLAYVHAQLDEQRVSPYFSGWNMGLQAGVVPPIYGTVFYTQTPISARNVTGFGNLLPFFTFDLNGWVPFYTFGKISSMVDSFTANVRNSEWDLERVRQQAHMDARRAYFGIQAARDAKYVIEDGMNRLKKAIDGLKEKLEKGDKAVAETD